MYCIMFKNCGELAVTVFCNPATCPLRMKTVTPILKNPLVCCLQTVGGQRWFHSDNKSQTFLGWSLIWGVSLLTVTLLKHFVISYQGQQSTLHRTSCTRRERGAASLLLRLRTRFLWLTAAPAKRFKQGIAADLIRRQLPSEREQLSSQYIQYRNVP